MFAAHSLPITGMSEFMALMDLGPRLSQYTRGAKSLVITRM
jgi:hypothetical protein